MPSAIGQSAFARTGFWGKSMLDYTKRGHMNEVTIRIPVRSSAEEARFTNAIGVFAAWQERTSNRKISDETAPLIVRTEMGQQSLLKTVIFQARPDAAIFLHLWRRERQAAMASHATS